MILVSHDTILLSVVVVRARRLAALGDGARLFYHKAGNADNVLASRIDVNGPSASGHW